MFHQGSPDRQVSFPALQELYRGLRGLRLLRLGSLQEDRPWRLYLPREKPQHGRPEENNQFLLVEKFEVIFV